MLYNTLVLHELLNVISTSSLFVLLPSTNEQTLFLGIQLNIFTLSSKLLQSRVRVARHTSFHGVASSEVPGSIPGRVNVCNYFLRIVVFVAPLSSLISTTQVP